MVTAEPPHPANSTQGQPALRPTSRTDPQRDRSVIGNERLTALAGIVLLVLALLEAISVPLLGSMLSLHFFVGVLLAGPVAVKVGSTSWRFIRYYTRHPAYRRKGPPHLALRLLAPLLFASTVTVIGSGIALAVTGPAPAALVQLHRFSFVVWMVTLVLHLVAHLSRVPRLIADDWRQQHTPPARGQTQEPMPSGRRARLGANIVALAMAAVPGFLFLPTASPWVGWAEGGHRVYVIYVGAAIIGAIALVFKRRAK